MRQALQEDARRWIVEADRDVNDAEMLLRYEAYYPLCRLAYLAAEKALRALVLGKGQVLTPQFDLSALTRQAASAEPALVSLISSLHPLERFAPPDQLVVIHATPPPPPLYSRETAKEAIALARQAVSEVKRALSGTP